MANIFNKRGKEQVLIILLCSAQSEKTAIHVSPGLPSLPTLGGPSIARPALWLLLSNPHLSVMTGQFCCVLGWGWEEGWRLLREGVEGRGTVSEGGKRKSSHFDLTSCLLHNCVGRVVRSGEVSRGKNQNLRTAYLSPGMWLACDWPMGLCCRAGLCLAEFVPDGGPWCSVQTRTQQR